MNVDEVVKNCEIYLKQIKQYDPDPYYVNYFFNQYIIGINNVINGIFEEANRDFGLFILKDISKQRFYEKAKEKKDKKAIEFSEWFSIKYSEEHKNPYPNFIKEICQFKNKFKKLPEIKIMISTLNKYKDDINHEIKVDLNQGKLRSKEEVDIEIKRQLPIFLEIINHKRNKKNEPKVKKNRIIATACTNIEKCKDIEIMYASKTYIPLMKRLVEESRLKIKELTR